MGWKKYVRKLPEPNYFGDRVERFSEEAGNLLEKLEDFRRKRDRSLLGRVLERLFPSKVEKRETQYSYIFGLKYPSSPEERIRWIGKSYYHYRRWVDDNGNVVEEIEAWIPYTEFIEDWQKEVLKRHNRTEYLHDWGIHIKTKYVNGIIKEEIIEDEGLERIEGQFNSDSEKPSEVTVKNLQLLLLKLEDHQGCSGPVIGIDGKRYKISDKIKDLEKFAEEFLKEAQNQRLPPEDLER